MGKIIIRLEHSGTFSQHRQCDHPVGKHFIKEVGSQDDREEKVLMRLLGAFEDAIDNLTEQVQ